MNIKQIQVSYVLGLVPDSELPELATQLLINGDDSLPLRQLAGLTSDEIAYEAPQLWAKALAAAGLDPVDLYTAAHRYAGWLLPQIIKGSLDPFIAAERLWDVSNAVKHHEPYPSDTSEGMSGFHALDPFVYCASEARSRPEDREFFREAILREAQHWLDEHPAYRV